MSLFKYHGGGEVQRESSTGTGFNSFLCATIPSKCHFLLVEADDCNVVVPMNPFQVLVQILNEQSRVLNLRWRQNSALWIIWTKTQSEYTALPTSKSPASSVPYYQLLFPYWDLQLHRIGRNNSEKCHQSLPSRISTQALNIKKCYITNASYLIYNDGHISANYYSAYV